MTTAVSDPLHDSIIAALAAGERNIYELSRATGVKIGSGQNPLKSPLNRALVALRDSGKIRVIESRSGFGQPLFALP